MHVWDEQKLNVISLRLRPSKLDISSKNLQLQLLEEEPEEVDLPQIDLKLIKF